MIDQPLFPLQPLLRSTTRPARVRPAALLALLLVCGLLLTVMWWWRERASQDQSHPPTSAALANRPLLDASGIDVAALRIKAWHTLAEFPQDVAQFETVFWEPQDTTSLRQWLSSYERLTGARVLEIGTGTGIIALLCAQQGAESVVATDINPQAVANTRYNAEVLGWTEKIEVRLVPANRPAPFAVIGPQEQFDLIISNPPWEDAAVHEVTAYALYDPGFALLDGLLQHSANNLRPQGKVLLAYGARTPIQRILATAPAWGWQVQVRDERELDRLPEVFVPGFLLELSRD